MTPQQMQLLLDYIDAHYNLSRLRGTGLPFANDLLVVDDLKKKLMATTEVKS